MRLLRTTAAAALPLLALGCSRRADTARADSASPAPSAAPMPADTARGSAPAAAPAAPATMAPGAGDSASPSSTAGGAAAPSAGTDSTRKRTATRPATAKPPTAAKPAAAATAPAPAANAPAAAAAAPAAPASAAAAAPAAGAPVRVNQFMSYDPATKTTDLQVIAAYNHAQGGFNFNGGSNGSHVITVPQGWTVRMDVKNIDAIPHSALIIKQQKPLPNAPDSPDIPRAYTAHVNDGLPPVNGEDLVTFRASPAGSYWIYCGVPGHGPSGMYISFIVAPDAPTPAYKM